MFWKKKKEKIFPAPVGRKKEATKRFALLGEDIQYSLSPKIHSIIYRELGVDATYELFDVKKEELNKSWYELINEFNGFNVTKPYKQEILEEITSKLTEFDAVNTVIMDYYVYKGIKQIDGTVGYNTDFLGFFEHLKSIQEESFTLKDMTALVLGAGGVAEVVVVALKDFGVKIHICNRSIEKAEKLADKFNVFNIKDKSNQSYDIVVNCTSYGLNEGENIAEGVDFSYTLLAYDTIYFDTEFLKTARKANVSLVVNGLDMLIYQAVASAEIFLGKEIKDKQALKKIILKELALESNSN